MPSLKFAIGRDIMRGAFHPGRYEQAGVVGELNANISRDQARSRLDKTIANTAISLRRRFTG